MLAGRQPSFLQMFYRNGAPHSTNAAKRNVGIRSANKKDHDFGGNSGLQHGIGALEVARTSEVTRAIFLESSR
jgi:hypothetical protein